ncbi:hypothetical protein ACFWPK_28270 [Nocardia sp. NPDC058519]|uniref:hypothetical protein n=1 Tax=Nocardia sp. NPDC058519 TaxID=3346535 RepID=UPI00365E2998
MSKYIPGELGEPISAREQLKASMMAELEGYNDEPHEPTESEIRCQQDQVEATALMSAYSNRTSLKDILMNEIGSNNIALNDDAALARRALGK